MLGVLPPFRVPTPWWQDLEPVHQRLPGAVVLRLITARRAAGHPMGGHATYLAQLAEGGGAAAAAGLTAWDGDPGTLAEHPLRMPWARPGGPQADLRWAATVVEPVAPPRQHRTWNLSSIWSIPVRSGEVWLKCVPPFFDHEPGVLGWLGGRGRSVPRLLAADGHRQLLGPMRGEDGYGIGTDELRQAHRTLVALQAGTTGHVDDLLAAGVPDRRWGPLKAALTEVVVRSAPADTALAGLLEGFDRRVAAIDECGLGDVLVHGDAHGGNVRVGTRPAVWFDWGDSAIGHPLLDLAVLDRAPPDGGAVEASWLEAWGRAVPGSDPVRAWDLLRPLALLRMAAVFQGFLDNIEPSEHPYHELDVAPCLARAADAARSAALP